MSKSLETNLAEMVVEEWGFHDTSFHIIIDDPERDSYDIQVKYYVDADRGGFCGYVDRTILTGITQSEAVAIEKKLNRVVDQKKKAHYAQFEEATA